MSESKSRQRIGILGGTFDPIHLGHLLIAEHAREQLELNQIWFVPAAVSPLKLANRPHSSAKQRVEMVKLATGGNPHFEVDEREITRGGTSFTVDTLREIRQETPDADLTFIMGADSLADLHAWKEPAEICQLAFVAVLARGGYPLPKIELLEPFLPRQSTPESHLIPMPQMEISSSDLRNRIHQGRSVRYQLHPAVEAYVHANGLYRELASA